MQRKISYIFSASHNFNFIDESWKSENMILPISNFQSSFILSKKLYLLGIVLNHGSKQSLFDEFLASQKAVEGRLIV